MRYIRQLSIGAALSLGVAIAPATLAAAAPPTTNCTIQAPAHARDETIPKCVAVEVTLDRLPAVGESATLRIQLRSQVPIGAARLSVRLSPSLRLDTAGSGLSAPRPVGLDQIAEQDLVLTSRGRAVTLRVTALESGPAQIQADLTDTGEPDEQRSAHGSTEFTVGVNSSHAGVAGTDGPAMDAGFARPVASGLAVPVAPPAPAAPPGQICAAGQFTVADKTGTWLAGRNIPVEVQGKTTSSAALTTYATGLTGAADGRYNLCFTAPVSTMYSVQVKFTTDSSAWRITNNAGNSTYTITTAPKTNVPSGSD